MMTNQHFFQPLLPGFHSHLKIPVAFFIANVEGRVKKKKTAKLRSDASKRIWEVKIDGNRLTDGWKEFAVAHDLRIGDIVIFRQERVLAFHVTTIGPSFCEIEYVSSLEDQTGNAQRKKKMKTNPRKETDSSFVANISASCLRFDRLNLPRSFVRENGLDTTRCRKIVVMNDKDESWLLELRGKNTCGTTYITRGWRTFCHDNELRGGSISTFELIQREKPPVLRLVSTLLEIDKAECSKTNEVEFLSTEPENDEVESLSTEPENDEVESLSTEPENDEVESLSTEPESNEVEFLSSEYKRKGKSIWRASSSTSQNRFVTVTLTHNNVRVNRLILPIGFTRVNEINNAKMMSLIDKHGVKWSTKLVFEKKRKRMRLVGGWKEFCVANGLKIGESIILELIRVADKSFLLQFCSKVMPQTKSECT